jgi:flavin reductase (DIM6/NTAB) family NADH-FMN oxidoreductase RutF
MSDPASKTSGNIDTDGSSGTDGTIDPRALRNALGCFTTGVTIITAMNEAGKKAGLTANSFSSVSLNPPLVSWSLALYAPSQPVFQDSSHFAVHVLARDQEDLAMHFATPSDDKFAGVETVEGLGQAPLLAGTLAIFQCRNAYRYYGGDHIIFLGNVEKFESREGAPLLFCRGAFGDFLKPAE